MSSAFDQELSKAEVVSLMRICWCLDLLGIVNVRFTLVEIIDHAHICSFVSHSAFTSESYPYSGPTLYPRALNRVDLRVRLEVIYAMSNVVPDVNPAARDTA